MKRNLLLSVLMLCMSLASYAQVTFNGNGDGTSWHDGLNWDSGSEPTSADDVIIPPNFDVVISMTGEVAESMEINSASSVTINMGADLSVGAISTGTGIVLLNATLNNNGTLLSTNSGSDNAIDVVGPSTVNNRGTMTIGGGGTNDELDFNGAPGGVFNNYGTLHIKDDRDGDDGIDMDAEATFNNMSGALLKITDAGGEGILICRQDAAFNNWGSVLITNPNSDGIETDDGVTFTNHRNALVEIIDADNDGLNIDDGDDLFDNAGFVRVINPGSEGLHLDNSNGEFINRKTGQLIIQYPDSEGMDIDGSFTNNGIVTITSNFSSSEHLDIASSGEVINNCLMTFNGSANGNPIIDINGGSFSNNSLVEIAEVAGSGDCIQISALGSFENAGCAVLNDASSGEIAIQDPGSQFLNNGIFTSNLESTTNNNGAFNNNGEIRTQSGTFTASPNAVAGTGTIGTGQIPAMSAADGCPPLHIKTIPTMSEWGLILFGLLLASLVSVGMYRRKRLAIG